MIMKSPVDKYKSIFSLTFITCVLYFCGYLSSDYYNKILGIKINYEALDIIKWGADFFIYSVIDFFATLSTLGRDWIRFEFIIVICLDIIILFLSRYISKNSSLCKLSFYSLIKKCKFTYWCYIFCIVIVILSIHYLILFIGKTDIAYMEIMKLGNLYVVYFYFIILNFLNILNILLSDWKLTWEKVIKNILIVPLLFLPALYGVYGRNYNFNCIHQSILKTSILLESHNGKNYILERNYNCEASEIIELRCDNVDYQYKIVNDEEYNLTVDKIYFFDFIKDRYNENND